jgi:hypothetical protein
VEKRGIMELKVNRAQFERNTKDTVRRGLEAGTGIKLPNLRI